MIGSNVPAHPIRGGLLTLFKYAEEWGCECAQTYLTLSRRWKVRQILPEESADFKAALQKSTVKQVIAHVPLIVNPASQNDAIWQKSKIRLSTELSLANELGIQFLVLHPGYCGTLTRKEGINRVIDALNDVADSAADSRVKILLETMAGQGTAIGLSFAEIAQILKGVEKSDLVGVCFDTCHAFAAGYDIRGYEACEDVLRKFDAIIGVEKLHAFHLNDAKGDLGCRIDRHAAIGEGKLGLQVFHAIVRDTRFHGVPKVLEIPTVDGDKIQQQLKLLRKLEATLEPIPELKGVRSQSTLDEAFSHSSAK